jgi:thioredoxin-related protein
MRRITLIFYILIFITVPLLCQSIKSESAQSVLKAAIQQAQSSQKNVFLVFHASWCKWCKRLEVVLEKPGIKKIIEDNYIVTFLDVLERDEKKKTLENPGSEEVLKSYGGEEAGLPFLVFLNGKSKMIANSNVMPGDKNIGYPGSNEEIGAFIKLLRKTAPHMSNNQCTIIANHLKKNAPR